MNDIVLELEYTATQLEKQDQLAQVKMVHLLRNAADFIRGLEGDVRELRVQVELLDKVESR